MSFLSELEAFIEEAWPLVENHESIARIQLDIDPGNNDLSVTLYLKDYDQETFAQVAWTDTVSDLMDALRCSLSDAAERCARKKEDGDIAENCRKQIKLLDISPLEELAQQAE